jgi:hypothetical protein
MLTLEGINEPIQGKTHGEATERDEIGLLAETQH